MYNAYCIYDWGREAYGKMHWWGIWCVLLIVLHIVYCILHIAYCRMHIVYMTEVEKHMERCTGEGYCVHLGGCTSACQYHHWQMPARRHPPGFILFETYTLFCPRRILFFVNISLAWFGDFDQPSTVLQHHQCNSYNSCNKCNSLKNKRISNPGEVPEKMWK